MLFLFCGECAATCCARPTLSALTGGDGDAPTWGREAAWGSDAERGANS